MVVKNKPDKELLYKLYVVDELPSTEISKIYNYHVGTIIKWLRSYNIHIRSRKESSNTNYILKKKYNNVKFKHLDSITMDGMTIKTAILFNIETEQFNIKNYFNGSSGYNGGSKTNKNCTNWLGKRAELILMSMFDHVERMSYHNKGYDFKCGLDYKIDAKSACYMKDYNIWRFHIKQNIIADYFLCLAFDNRNDLNPKHVWLIPGKIVNHLKLLSIPESKIDKWVKYEQPLNKIVACCDIMKDK